MQIAIGGAAIAFIFLTLLTLITLYWVLTQWQNFAKQIPVVGGALAGIAQYLKDRNLEIINQVLVVGHSLISWSIDAIASGFRILHDLYNATIVSQLGAFGQGLDSLRFWRDTVATAAISSLQGQFNVISQTVNGFVLLNIQAFQFWKDATTALLRDTILPNLASLTLAVDSIARVALPQLSQQLDALSAQTLGWIQSTGKQLEVRLTNLQTTTTAVLSDPIKGIIPRVGTLENGLAQVLPWAAAIGLTIPIAATLARVGRNPCTCLEDQGGQTDMLPLLMFLYVDND